MTFEQLALAASVVFAGLWSGLLGMLTLVLVFVVLAVIVTSMIGFNQRWNVEVESRPEQRDPEPEPAAA